MTLRGRILALTVGVATLVLALFAVPLALLLHQAATDDARQSAVDLGQGVADYVSTGTNDAVLSDYVNRINDREDSLSVQVTLADGTSVGADLPAWGDTDGDGDGDRDGDGEQYGDLRPTSTAEVRDVDGGRLVRIAVHADEGTVVVYAFASDNLVRETEVQGLLLLGLAALVLLLAAAGAAEWVARRLVRHLAAAASTADQLGEGDLTARVPDEGPEEVRRVGAALNRLAGRMDELLAAERETVADLSHRLRTPLMAVRLDVESLPACEAKDDLEEHVAILERTLTAVIHTARRPQREGVSPHCDAAEVARERFEFWAPLTEDQGREVTLHIDAAPLPVRCAEADLRAAVDALLENAVAHTPEGTAIAVVVDVDESSHVLLDVRDRGPGVPPSALPRGRSDRGSSGLGLDIARSCAEASGGRLELVSVDGWSAVRLVLGHPTG